jgi:hypothetical protein
MPLDPNTNQWVEDAPGADVSKNLTGLLSQNNDYMKSARTQGMQAANKRGLQNSSMAVGAAQGAAIERALPIAQQQASQVHQRNLSGQEYSQQGGLLSQQQAHETATQERQIGANEATQIRDIQAQAESQGRQITADEQSQIRDLENRVFMQQADFLNQQVLQASEFGQRTEEQQRAISAATEDLIRQLESQEKVSFANIAAHDREKAAALAASFEATYGEVFRTIGQNPDLPAKVRDKYLAQAAAQRDSNYNLLESLYGVDIVFEDEAAA